MLSPILPAAIKFSWVMGPVRIEDLFKEEQDLLGPNSNLHYRESFARGRIAAHRCFDEHSLPRQAILRGPNREPLWPQETIGSISHTGDLACAAVALKKDCRYLGIDLEKINRHFDAKIVERICTAKERSWIASDSSPNSSRLRLIFCAKESVFKAFHPLVKHPISFQDVELNASDNDINLQGELLADLSPAYPKGYAFMVHSFADPNYLLTVLYSLNS